MYLEHFGLNKKPFSLTPDPGFLYLSDKHSIAMAMLEYGLFEQTGITVLTGDIGMGKTTLLRQLLDRLDPKSTQIGLINNTHAEFGSLLETVCLAFDLDIDAERPIILFKRIQDHVISQYAQGKRTLLVIDEAQNLSKEQLEQVRLLTNINAEEDLLLNLVLVGQPQLREKLKDPDLAQITQRISSEYHLTPLSMEETSQYIQHRLKVAGQTRRIFDLPSRAGIYYYSGGAPRLINKLCDYCLLVAFAKNESRITVETLVEVVIAQRVNGVNRLHHDPRNAEAVRRSVQELTGIDLAEAGSQETTGREEG